MSERKRLISAHGVCRLCGEPRDVRITVDFEKGEGRWALRCTSVDCEGYSNEVADLAPWESAILNDAEVGGHEHEWTRCPECPVTGACPCSGGPCPDCAFPTRPSQDAAGDAGRET